MVGIRSFTGNITLPYLSISLNENTEQSVDGEGHVHRSLLAEGVASTMMEVTVEDAEAVGFCQTFEVGFGSCTNNFTLFNMAPISVREPSWT